MVLSKLKVPNSNPLSVKAPSTWSVQRKIEKYVSSALNDLKKKSFEQYIGAWNNSAYMDDLYQKASREVSIQWNIDPSVCEIAKEHVRGKYYIAMSGF
jgi:hypothetical protein